MGFFTKTATLAAASCLAATLTFAPANAADKKINIGWTAWSDAEAVTKLAKKVLEDRMGYKVEMTMADIGIQYQGIATGKLDAMLMSWQPLTSTSPISTRSVRTWSISARCIPAPSWAGSCRPTSRNPN